LLLTACIFLFVNSRVSQQDITRKGYIALLLQFLILPVTRIMKTVKPKYDIGSCCKYMSCKVSCQHGTNCNSHCVQFKFRRPGCLL